MTTAVSPVLDRLRHTTVRPTEVVRAAYGLVELVAPAAPAGRVLGVRRDRTERAVARLLGARQLTQAVLTTLADSPRARLVGGGVDALHAVTMAGWAVADRRRGRQAWAEALTATLFAAAELGPSLPPARSRPWVGVRPPGRRVRPLDDTGRADGRLGGRGLPEAGRARAPEPRAGAAHAGRVAAERRRRRCRSGQGPGDQRPRPGAAVGAGAPRAAAGARPWLRAVASDAAMGRLYVISEEAVRDAELQTPKARQLKARRRGT